MIEHKGYIGKVEFDDESGIFHGEVVNVATRSPSRGDRPRSARGDGRARAKW